MCNVLIELNRKQCDMLHPFLLNNNIRSKEKEKQL